MDSAWQRRLDAVLQGSHFEPLRSAMMCAPDGTPLATSPGALVYGKDGWSLRLCPDRETCVAMNKATKAFKDRQTEAWRIRTGKTGAYDFPAFQTITPADHWHAVLTFADGQTGRLDGIHPFCASPLLPDERRFRGMALSGTRDLSVLGKSKTTWVSAFFPDFQLPEKMGKESTVVSEFPLSGKSWARTRFIHSKQEHWEWELAHNENGILATLWFPAELDQAVAKERFESFVDAISFTFGRRLIPCMTHVSVGTDWHNTIRNLPENPPGIRPLWQGNLMPDSTDLVRRIIDESFCMLMRSDAPLIKLVKVAMHHVYASSHPAVPTDTRMLVICAQMEKLIQVVGDATGYKKPEGDACPTCKRTSKRGERAKEPLFRHVADALGLPWEDGFQGAYEAWLNRDKIAHGTPRVFASMDTRDAFANRSRIEGGFNALLAGILRIQGFICLSAFEDEPREFLLRTHSHQPGSEEERLLREKLNQITIENTGL